jgi:hypothetical protein
LFRWYIFLLAMIYLLFFTNFLHYANKLSTNQWLIPALLSLTTYQMSIYV